MSVRRGAALLSLAVFAILSFLTASASAAPIATLNYTGADQTWTVPDGVTAVDMRVSGGGGGGGCYGIAGGAGARVDGSLAVSPGQVLQVTVGGQGGTCST